jgi:hypothetical protein
VGWTAMMLIDSIASPVFNAAPTFPLLFTLAAILRSGQAVTRTRLSETADSVRGGERPAASPTT